MIGLTDRSVVQTVSALSVAAAVASVATLLLPARVHDGGFYARVVFGVGYAFVFLVAQRMGFLLHWRGHSTRVSIEEFALVGGLLLIPPPLVVATVVAAAILHQATTRRPLVKAAFNVAQYALAASAAVGVFTALDVLGVPPVLAALSGPFAFALVSQGCTAFLFARLEGDAFGRVFRARFLEWTLLSGVIGASLGLGAYALWVLSPFALVAIVPVFLLLARFGRLTEWAEEEVRVHKALGDATTRVAATGELDDVAEGILETCRDIFGAGEVRVTLPTAAGPERTWRWTHEQGSAAHGVRVPIPAPEGPAGELVVFPRPGASAYGARDRHLLTIVAGAAGGAALGTRTLAQLKDANRRLSNANRELEEFTLWTTHDMREPLRSVGQLARILREDLDVLSDDDARDLAQRIERGAEGLKERIKALHEFSRIVQEDKAFEEISLDDLIDETLDGLAARIAERRAHVVRPTRELPRVRAQGARLAKVFGNLLENALKYSDKPQPRVEIDALDRGAEWEIVVRDDGPGIDPAFRERAFQLFQRGPNAQRTAQSGSGAGLAIVKRIVEQHGGRVWIADVPAGSCGSEFRFTLPKAGVRTRVEVPTAREALAARVGQLV